MNTIVRTTIRKNKFGEWVVRCFNSEGKHIPSCDYFASDKQDAEISAREAIGTTYTGISDE